MEEQMARGLGAFAAVAILVVAGCAHGVTTDTSEFGSEGGGGLARDEQAALPPGNDPNSGAGDVTGVTAGSACATSTVGAAQVPISLVFMMDRSGSMGGNAIDARWNAAVDSLETFFATDASSTIKASLAFFAASNECDLATYAAPQVALRPLPDPVAFSAALGATQPAGETPTLPAMQGAIAYAQQVKAALTDPHEKVAIVLVTDGDPNTCGSTPENVAAEAARVAGDIKTYVVGVGNLAHNLDTIAIGGGTYPHIQVDASSAENTSTQLRAAISKIKAAALGCTFPLPAPPNRAILDLNAVNVDYTPAGEASTTLPYSKDCANTGGWHYDDTTAPTEIVMCPRACNTLQDDTTGGHVDVIFGCQTLGDLPH
jgi:hypothetical protein